jgi:uncharacterized protein (DUF2147 family)
MTIRLAAAGLALLASSAALAQPASPVGKWLTEDRRGVIEIAPCGASLCGRIAGMAGATADGPPATDFRGRPQCGLEIIHEIVPGDPGEWNATITDPENGNLYGARLWLDDAGRLHLRGYLRVPLIGSALGSTQIWNAYTGTLTPDCRMRT